ncbi:methyltransferase domain-containing protein [Geminocystis sp. GBBB08]|uniref:class I SAM-dependent methyltransferase n=1 Tax=Geminocystis sp. GBBB08 TaxID=2604140 RepID=UPI0027E25A49|nr:methyltransferase domain-containing protein [Geminocystis sp. GBBB08]MBL1208172.1 methyltransferase domain-containing protein [Geminocystis sp. GBBB08]
MTSNQKIIPVKNAIKSVPFKFLPLTASDIQELGLRGIHCGSGLNLHSGWLNMDYLSITDELGNQSKAGNLISVGEDTYYLQCDQTQKIPIDDEVFDYAFSEHFIEHISLQQAVEWLKEIRRLLKPDGILRLSTPDLYLYVSGYLDSSNNFYQQHHQNLTNMGFKNPPQRKAWMVNQIFRFWGHQWIYDFEEIQTIAVAAGFKPESVVKCKFREGSIPEVYRLDLAIRSDESLYVEIHK